MYRVSCKVVCKEGGELKKEEIKTFLYSIKEQNLLQHNMENKLPKYNNNCISNNIFIYRLLNLIVCLSNNNKNTITTA